DGACVRRCRVEEVTTRAIPVSRAKVSLDERRIIETERDAFAVVRVPGQRERRRSVAGRRVGQVIALMGVEHYRDALPHAVFGSIKVAAARVWSRLRFGEAGAARPA